MKNCVTTKSGLDFSKNYILENDYVRLEPLTYKHFEELLLICEDFEIWKYLLEKGSNKNQLQAYVSEAIDNRTARKEYPFAVYDKLKKAYAGTTRFYDYSQDIQVIKLGHTWYGKNFRGTQVNKNCKYLLLRFGFENVHLERIGFGIHSENKISINALKSIGCQKEGVLRNFIPSVDKTGRSNIVLMSILKKEWYAFAKAQLEQKLNPKA